MLLGILKIQKMYPATSQIIDDLIILVYLRLKALRMEDFKANGENMELNLGAR